MPCPKHDNPDPKETKRKEIQSEDQEVKVRHERTHVKKKKKAMLVFIPIDKKNQKKPTLQITLFTLLLQFACMKSCHLLCECSVHGDGLNYKSKIN